MTIDELAAAAGTTTRRIRSFQTLGLLPHPELRGRTGLYDAPHRDRLSAILRLQEAGFSLESLRILFEAHDAGRSLAAVLGLAESRPGRADRPIPPASPARTPPSSTASPSCNPPPRGRRGRPLLSVVPTTVWDESEAS